MLRVKLTSVADAVVLPCIALALAVAFSSTAFAQTPARRQSPTPGATDAQADLSITARVTARELRFEKVPNPTVEFTGRPRRETVWEAERENLPEQVQPGVTYRNIGITLRITSVFADIDRIVAEALGEIPVSDDAQPQSATSERHITPPASAHPADVAAPHVASEKPAPQTDAQTVAASDSSPARAAAARSAQRTRHARKGRSN